MYYDKRNRENLAKLAPNTRYAAMQLYEFAVKNNIEVLIYDTIRTSEQQALNIKNGVSWTMKSYHIVGQALDFVPTSGKQDLWNGYGSANIKKFIEHAKMLGFEWGGDWKEKDMPHLQYNYKGYGTDKKLDAKPINVIYGTHVADLGWLPDVKNDSDYAGTVGQKRRVEAVEIRLENAPDGASIEYQVHVADKGWLPVVANGAVAGTTGEARRVEAIRIWIKNLPNYTVEYRVHMKDKGWSSWMRDGEIAGTVGEKRRIEAIQIRLKVV